MRKENLKNLLRFDLGGISRHRTELMGIAALMILCCHADQFGVPMSDLFKRVCHYCNLGVEVFFLCSGIGMFRSLERSKVDDESIFSWYRRRFTRLLVPYLLLSIPYWLAVTVAEHGTLWSFLLNLSTYTFWSEHVGAWFVAALIPLYLVTPALYWILKKSKLTYWTLALLLFLLFNVFYDRSLDVHTDLLANICWVGVRIPCFLIGLGTAEYVFRPVKLNILLPVILPMVLHHFLDVDHDSWCLTFLLAVPLAVFSAWILDFIPRSVCSVMSFFGVISLESYLANIYLKNLAPGIAATMSCNALSDNLFLEYSVVLVLGTAIAFAAWKLGKKIS